MNFFLDSSALVKRYVLEVGSDWVNQLVDPALGNRIWISRISGVEVIAAISRRASGGGLVPTDAQIAIQDFRDDFARQYRIVEISPPRIVAAMDLAERRLLRAYDALQLASAMHVNTRRAAAALAPLTIVSADLELNDAALAEGQVVEVPNQHP